MPLRSSPQHLHLVFSSTVIEVLLLRIADLVVDVADVLDISVSEIVAFPPSERLAFHGIMQSRPEISIPFGVLLLHQMFPSFSDSSNECSAESSFSSLPISAMALQMLS